MLQDVAKAAVAPRVARLVRPSARGTQQGAGEDGQHDCSTRESAAPGGYAHRIKHLCPQYGFIPGEKRGSPTNISGKFYFRKRFRVWVKSLQFVTVSTNVLDQVCVSL